MHLEELSSRNIPIEFVGHLSKENLARYFQASDCFVSLSTFEGEDWGRAVFEARLHGLPAVLTAWGGFRDLHKNESIFLCPVSLENGNLVIDEKYFFEMMNKALLTGLKPFDHSEISLASISSDLKSFYASSNLEKIEYSSFFKMLVHFHIMQGNGDQEFYERYEELFSSYWK
jgi:glycosyltransferase involved in cell wall biosynthesis